jgi:hypothetical protein
MLAAFIIRVVVIEVASNSEHFYQTTWCYNPEDSHLHTCCHQNLKFYLDFQFVVYPVKATRHFCFRWVI